MRRKVQRVLSRLSLLVLLCLLVIVVLNVALVMMEELRQRVVDMRNKAELLTRRRQRLSDNYDVIVSSYMNSSSSFTAGLLGLRADAFYMYEPLWQVAPWHYYRTNTTVCSMRHMSCKTLTNEEMNVNIPAAGMPVDFAILHDKDISEQQATPILVPQRVLEHVYSCAISKLQNVIRPDVTLRFSGASWDHYGYCIKRKYRREECLRQLDLKCVSAKHRVTKVLRLTVSALNLLLNKIPRLKVVHLFRDPRAIINSRLETDGYPLSPDPEQVHINAKVLCDKMAVDLRQGRELKRKFPARFFFAHYEDLFTNVSSMIKLHDELGMSLTRGNLMSAKLERRNRAASQSQPQVTARQANNAYWWRENLPYDFVAAVDKVCFHIYHQLGYPIVQNSEDLKNYSIPDLIHKLKHTL